MDTEIKILDFLAYCIVLFCKKNVKAVTHHVIIYSKEAALSPITFPSSKHQWVGHSLLPSHVPDEATTPVKGISAVPISVQLKKTGRGLVHFI